MKKIVAGAIALMFCYGFVVTSEIKKKKFTLQELIEHPEVEVQLISDGDYSGECVKIEINSNLKHAIQVEISEGTLFYPEDSNDQTLVVPRMELITLAAKENKKVKANGFCTESSDGAPSKGGKFTIGKTSDTKLIKLLSFFKTHKVNDDNVQEAVWCVTDNASLSNIYEDGKNSELKRYVAKITGNKIPWQSTRRRLSLNRERRIVAEAIEVKGMIQFKTDKLTTVKSKIIKENGELIYENAKSVDVSKSNKINLKFNVKVQGWDKGNYFVIYFTSEGKELVKQKFTV